MPADRTKRGRKGAVLPDGGEPAPQQQLAFTEPTFITFAAPQSGPPTKQAVHAKKGPDNHIPRPPNAFILYRSSFKSQQVSTEVKTNHSTLSKIAGLTWKGMAENERRFWHDQARAALEKHKEKFPKEFVRRNPTGSGLVSPSSLSLAWLPLSPPRKRPLRVQRRPPFGPRSGPWPAAARFWVAPPLSHPRTRLVWLADATAAIAAPENPEIHSKISRIGRGPQTEVGGSAVGPTWQRANHRLVWPGSRLVPPVSDLCERDGALRSVRGAVPGRLSGGFDLRDPLVTPGRA